MTLRSLLRAIPALLTAILIALSLWSARSVKATPAASPQSALGSACDQTLQVGFADTSVTLGPNCGVTQPIGMVANVAACSLGITYVYDDDGMLRVIGWNPLGLAPDPTTVALRTVSFDPSQLEYNHLALTFDPPIVLRQADHLAEPPPAAAALDFQFGSGAWNYGIIANQVDASPDVPVAYRYASTGVRTPLAGPHPALAHQVCGGDDPLQQLRVVQSVVRCDSVLDLTSYEYVQRFSIPVHATLQWVEIAVNGSGYFVANHPLGTIAVLDATGQTTPPETLPSSLVQAAFGDPNLEPHTGWISHYDFDQIIALEPGHDYWLLVRTVWGYRDYARRLTGAEGPDFTSSIGPLYSRTASIGPWTPMPGLALDFRLIGHPYEVAAVSPPAAPRAGFALRVSPNPVRGAALVQWSGATGAVRLMVVDERGRRVSGTASSAGSDRWRWSGRSTDGGVLPPGVYFIRATDGAGRQASERVSLVR